MVLTGQVTDVLPLLAAMDIGVLCSKGESLSNAIIEYMVASLPCVVSDVGGNREAIGGEHGLVFPGDDVDGMVEQLERLIENPELRNQLGRSGERYARETYEYSVVVGQHEELYNRYLAASGRDIGGEK